MSRTAQRKYLPAHLFSATGKFLGSPASISPERVMGVPTDARSDVYAPVSYTHLTLPTNREV